MAKKYEFRPDKPHSGFFNKLYLTQTQRKAVLKWFLYAMVLLVLSLLQDVILCNVRLYGATTDLVPCGIFLICLLEGVERGCVFALVSALLYVFSGSAPGTVALVLITGAGVGVCLFRQSYLQKGFGAAWLCTAAALILYELAVFAINLFLGLTLLPRVVGFGITAGLSILVVPVLYPVVLAISAIGGESWKE